MRRVLVTGASSLLGVALTRRLMAAGVEVHAVVRRETASARFQGLPKYPVLHIHDGATESMLGIVGRIRPDIVFHLASLYGRDHAPEQVEPLVRSNVLFGTQLVEAMAKAGATRLVNAGSYFQFHGESADRPLNLYAATKRAFESVLAYYADAAALDAVTLVLYDLYGPGDRRTKLTGAILECLRSGTPLRLPAEDTVLDLVYVDDAADAFVHAAGLIETRPDDVRGRSFAVGSGERRRIGDIVDAFEAVLGGKVERLWGAYPTPARRIVEPWRGPALPGWRARVPLAEGIRRLAAAGGADGERAP